MNKEPHSYGFIWQFKTENYPLQIEPYIKIGMKLSEETKQKISKSNKGKGRKKGISASDETKIKISKALKGRTVNWIKHSNETKKKMSDISPNKKIVLQYSLEGNFIKEWDSIKEIENKLKILGVSGVCRGKCEQSGGFIWRYKTEKYPLRIDPYVKKENTRKKSIYQYSKDGIFIKEWNSLYEASHHTKVGSSDISRCCNNKKKTAGEFIWKFK
jgi:hypothetical protein